MLLEAEDELGGGAAAAASGRAFPSTSARLGPRLPPRSHSSCSHDLMVGGGGDLALAPAFNCSASGRAVVASRLPARGCRRGSGGRQPAAPRSERGGRDVHQGQEEQGAAEGDLPRAGRGGGGRRGRRLGAAAPPAGLEGRQRGARAALCALAAGTAWLLPAALLPGTRPVSTAPTAAGAPRRVWEPPNPARPRTAVPFRETSRGVQTSAGGSPPWSCL